MSTMARRGFLKFLGAAPIAGPVVAQEAAAKMGMGSVLSALNIGGSGEAFLDKPYPTSLANEATGMVEYWRSQLGDLLSDQNIREMRRRVIRNGEARTLDADLAAMRSASPAAVYQLQIERCIARRIENDRSNILERIRDYASGTAKSAATSIY